MQNPTDLVYKVGIGNEADNWLELRHSIRSAKRHFKDLNNIYIVGHKPNWLNNVIHVNLSDPYTHNKDANLINKLIRACLCPDLTQKFINMSDDYFFLKDMTADDFARPTVNNKVLETMATPGKKLTKWELRLKRTVDVLGIKGLPVNCYETHGPQLLDKTLFPQILLDYDYGEGNGMCGNTLYFNTLKADYKHFDASTFTRLEDKKLTINEIDVLLDDKKQLFNYTINCYNHVMQQFLAQKFPDRTVYEIS